MCRGLHSVVYGFYICVGVLVVCCYCRGVARMRVTDCGLFVSKVMKRFNDYSEELRQINSASTIRRGRKARGYSPKAFEDVFDYSQPRRNKLGAGDLKVTNTITGEITMYNADDVSRLFVHVRSPKHSQYNLSYDKKAEVDPT